MRSTIWAISPWQLSKSTSIAGIAGRCDQFEPHAHSERLAKLLILQRANPA
jgi:hypothetical protein